MFVISNFARLKFCHSISRKLVLPDTLIHLELYRQIFKFATDFELSDYLVFSFKNHLASYPDVRHFYITHVELIILSKRFSHIIISLNSSRGNMT